MLTLILLISKVLSQCQSLDYKAVVGTDPQSLHSVSYMTAAASEVNQDIFFGGLAKLTD
jgi:hypothetical protein